MEIQKTVATVVGSAVPGLAVPVWRLDTLPFPEKSYVFSRDGLRAFVMVRESHDDVRLMTSFCL